MAEQGQNFDNHTRFVLAYHYVAMPIFAMNLLWSVYRFIVVWLNGYWSGACYY